MVPEDGEITIYATVYPMYALADAVLRDVPNVRLNCLVQPQDGCLRRYELSDWDRAVLGEADAVIAGGRGLESFEGALFALGGDGPAVTAALYNLPLYNPATDSHDGESESHWEGPNPHLYMSVDGAKRIVESIAASMLTMDPDYGDLYEKNAREAGEALDALWEALSAAVDAISGQPVILMNEALVYVARDYGLDVVGQIERESGEALYDEALEKCLDTMRESGARVALIERQAPAAFVRALEEAGFRVARLDILSTRSEAAGFETYLNVQRANAAALQEAYQALEEDAP